MAEINFNIMSPISGKGTVKNNHPQKIEVEHLRQGVRNDSFYANASDYPVTERIKVEVSGLELLTGQVNDSISMLETI